MGLFLFFIGFVSMAPRIHLYPRIGARDPVVYLKTCASRGSSKGLSPLASHRYSKRTSTGIFSVAPAVAMPLLPLALPWEMCLFSESRLNVGETPRRRSNHHPRRDGGRSLHSENHHVFIFRGFLFRAATARVSLKLCGDTIFTCDFRLRLLFLHVQVIKMDDCVGATVEARISLMGDGDIVLLENVRFHSGEEVSRELL